MNQARNAHSSQALLAEGFFLWPPPTIAPPIQSRIKRISSS